MSLHTINLTGELGWETNLTATYNKNKIKDLNSDVPYYINQIPETDITRLSSRLHGMCIHFRLVLEDSVRNIAVEDINGIVLCQHRYIGVIDLVNVIRNVAVQFTRYVLVRCLSEGDERHAGKGVYPHHIGI